MKKTVFKFLMYVGFSLQAFGQTPTKRIEGAWTGVLEAGGTTLHLQVTVTKSDAGVYAGKFESLDQAATIPLEEVTFSGDDVAFESRTAGIRFDGVLNSARSEIAGTFKQTGQAIPLTLKRSDPSAPNAASNAARDTCRSTRSTRP